MQVFDAALGLLKLDAILFAAFVLAIFGLFWTHKLFGFSFCQVCTAVSSVWILNILVRVLPTWVTIFLMGQSVAGGAALVRDRLSARFHANDRPDTERRLIKQLSYFGAILVGTLGAIAILAIAYPELRPA